MAFDAAKIDKVADAVIGKNIRAGVENRVLKYGGGTQADVNKVLKRIGQKLA